MDDINNEAEWQITKLHILISFAMLHQQYFFVFCFILKGCSGCIVENIVEGVETGQPVFLII